ncbi:MAG: NADPH-dependent oxidoreductase [Alphaproteobacteria bacterium]|nr:MAG: NADPH-dependent oxidoreductase [Alphaproteobacteria bacterium]
MKRYALANLNLADIGLVNPRMDFDFPQVVGDDEQFGRFQAGGNGLARLDAAFDDDAGDGGFDHGAFQVNFGLRDYPLPIYDGDDEAANGVPENALKLKALFKESDGLIIATPEYNTSISGVLKNTIDWVSRPVDGEAFLECFTNKAVGIVSGSLGPLGGMRAQAHLRQILSGINMLVIPEHWGVGSANDDSFNEDGSLKDNMGQGMVQRVGTSLAALLQRMAD